VDNIDFIFPAELCQLLGCGKIKGVAHHEVKGWDVKFLHLFRKLARLVVHEKALCAVSLIRLYKIVYIFFRAAVSGMVN